MASRRSRLKAVANLPIRRKPLTLQQENEAPLPLQEAACEKERDDACSNENEKICQTIEDNSTPAIDSMSPPKDSFRENQVEIDSDKVVPFEKPCGKLNNPDPAPIPCSRFGRRVKPSVSLSVLRDKPQRAEKPQTLSSGSSSIVDEFKSSENSNTMPNVTDNILNESVVDLNTLAKDKNAEAIAESVLNNPTVDKPEENVAVRSSNESIENIINQTECFIPEPGDLQNKSSKRQITVQSLVNNFNRPIISQCGLPLENFTQASQDTKQRIEVSPVINRNVTEPLSQLPASQNSVQLQNNVRRGMSFVKQKKVKFNDFARKVADARREFQRKYEKIPPDRSSLRMIDLIFYNPSTNPMESKSKYEKKDLHSNDEELLNEARVDDPEPVDKSSEMSADDDLKNDDFGKMPVPQVKIGLNGEIILDEKSLVIETTDAKKGREDLQNSVPVFEDRGSKTCYYKRKTQKSRDWSDVETKRFYKALNTIGTDFSLMQKYFPLRTRLELKNKFKREEKLNRSLIDKALNNPSEFDITQFEKYLAMEKQVEDEENGKRVQRKIGRIKRSDHPTSRIRSSLLAKEITESDEDGDLQCFSKEDQVKMKLLDKAKKSNDNDLLLEKYCSRENVQRDGATEALPALPEEGAHSTSNLIMRVDVNKLTKIRDAFDEIQNVKNGGVMNVRDSQAKEMELENFGTNKEGSTDVVDEFYQAVVSLSASLKSASEEKTIRGGKKGSRAKPVTKRGEKRKATTQGGRKNSTKDKDGPFISTLDIETYDSKSYDSISSNESNDNSFMSTKSISGQDFINLLAANAKNMTESKIQFQITEDCSLEKNVEIILDNVPSIALNEI